MRRAFLWVPLAGALTWSQSARAQPTSAPAPEPAPAPVAAPAEDRPPGERPTTRPEDARGWAEEPGTEPEDVALFVPRAVLFVPKLALQLVFLPLEGLLTLIDRHHVVPRVEDLLYFNPEHTAGVYPLVGLESGYGLSYGAKIFHNDLAGHGESLSLAGRFGGRYVQGYRLKFEGEHVGGSDLWLEAMVRYDKQPGILFHGFGNAPTAGPSEVDLGPRDAAVATRFQQERLLWLGTAGRSFGGKGDLTQLGGTFIYNHRKFRGERADYSEPSIERVYDVNRIPGFVEGANTVELNLRLVRDTRNSQGLASRGLFLESFAGGVPPFGDYRYWHFGAEAVYHVNLYRDTRVLVLRAAFEGVAGEQSEIPFVELPRLGGANDLRGYLSDRFRDKLAAVATVEYRYPIHQHVAGALFVDAGHVGSNPENLIGSDPFSDWKLGAGGGLLFHGKDSVWFGLEVAYGDGLTAVLATDPLRFFSKRSLQL